MFFGAPQGWHHPAQRALFRANEPCCIAASEILDNEKALPIVWWYTVLYCETYKS